jgi:hypothetical protein
MVDRFDTTHTVSDLEYFFPIVSQTSSIDKLFLLGTMRLVRNTGAYNYLEIGSFRGGSFAIPDGPSLRNNIIDRRPRWCSSR